MTIIVTTLGCYYIIEEMFVCLFVWVRYKLLLEGMLKNTEKDHADRPLLQTAIEQISDVASFINDSIKRRENQAKIWGRLPD